MSATGRNLAGNERRPDDFYATPAWCTELILPHLADASVVFDPCCGEGAILDVARARGSRTAGLELDVGRAQLAGARGHHVWSGDALGRRADFHRRHPSDVFVLPRRPSFTGGGTDATEYAWFVWGPGRGNRWYVLTIDNQRGKKT